MVDFEPGLASLAGAVEPAITLLHLDRKDDDFLDKLNHKLSSLVFFSLMLSVLLYQIIVEKVIRCWTPAQFPEHWTEYANNLCWVKNTFFVADDEDRLPEPSDRLHIVYYQWVPYVLFGLTVMSYMPGLVWYSGSKYLGMDINYMVKSLREMDVAVNPDIRDRYGKCIAKHIVRAIAINRDSKRGRLNAIEKWCSRKKIWCGPSSGNFLQFLWFATKSLYITTVFMQFYVLTKYIGPDFVTLGSDAVRYIFANKPRPPVFPKVTLCEFSIRSIGENIPYTMQCTLPVNIMNEKVFIFAWFWLIALGVVNIYGFAKGVWTYFDAKRNSQVKLLLRMSDSYRREDLKALRRFTNDFLRSDGIITLTILGKNSSPVVVTEIVKVLWEMYNFDPKFPLPSTRDEPQAWNNNKNG